MPHNVLDYLEATAARLPDKPAFSDEKTCLTFGELRARARALGSLLARTLPPGTPIAVCMNRGCNVMLAFMAAVYAGCFYTFLDHQQPAARLDQMLLALDPGLVLTDESGAKKTAALHPACPVLDLAALDVPPEDAALLEAVRERHVDVDPLYCNFTSGSSGAPKGVVVSHRSVIDFIEEFVPLFGVTEADVIANQAPLDFDISVKDIYPALKTGASVVIVPKAYFMLLPKLLDLLAERAVTTLTWGVSALCMISSMDGFRYRYPAHINKVLFSGELMPCKQLAYWRRYYPNALFVNLYGPTEITCNCTYHILTRDYAPGESIPIGVPFPNERVFLLDEADALVTAPNVPGELCVGGTALALGYYRDAEKTAAAFVQNPRNKAYLEPIYRTGDLARYDEAGLLHFIGRRDLQIKRHGRRLELGEIDAALHSLPGVERACTLYVEEKQLILAFYMGEAPAGGFVRRMRTLLPDYMIPGEFVRVSSFPLTKNGKLDRAALRALYEAQRDTEEKA